MSNIAQTQQSGVTPVFRIKSSENKLKSKEAGRPIYEDKEVVEVRFAGNSNMVSVFPAHAVWRVIDGQPVSYAMRWQAEYDQWKQFGKQSTTGTPIEELPFLTQSRRMELKALHIYTAEALAALEGQPLNNIGQGGRDLKDQAAAYLETASSVATVAKQDEEIAKLRAEIEAMRNAGNASVRGEEDASDGGSFDPDASPFADMDEGQLKDWIADATGQRPRGNPSKATLVRMADEASAEIARKKAELAE